MNPKYYPSTLFSATPSLCSSLNVRENFHTHTETQEELEGQEFVD
jgi:hypothetical protein